MDPVINDPAQLAALIEALGTLADLLQGCQSLLAICSGLLLAGLFALGLSSSA